MKTNVLFPEKLGGTDVTQFIGRNNELFYDAETGFLRISDGVTPGGTLLNMIGRQGYAGAFFDTTTQTNLAEVNRVKFNTAYISDGVTITDQSKIGFLHAGRYNIQFSLQLEKTDSGTDIFEVFFLRNGAVAPWTNTKITLVGNSAKAVAAWNYLIEEPAGVYIELAWLPEPVCCMDCPLYLAVKAQRGLAIGGGGVLYFVCSPRAIPLPVSNESGDEPGVSLFWGRKITNPLPVQAVILPAHPNTKQKSPDPTAGKGNEIGGSSFQVVVPGSTGQRAGRRLH
jgi:hypothetical protein